MRRSRLFLGLVPALPVAVAVGACTEAPVNVGLVMMAPQGLLDTATRVTLRVFDTGNATCTPATGRVENAPTGDAVQTFELQKGSCGEGVTWCKEIELDRDGAEKIFAVTAEGSAGVLAEGCAVEKVDQDPLEVTIKVQRYTPPACCNDGAIGTGEQCDLGPEKALACDGSPAETCGGIAPDAVCRCDCTAQEILLSVDNVVKPELYNDGPGTKTHLAMEFCPGIDATKNALRTAYTSTTGSGGGDILMRFLAADLYPIQKPYPLAQQLQLPARCTTLTASGPPLVQRDPSLAPVGLNHVAIVYASDQEATNNYHIYLNAQNEWGCADVPPLKVSTQVGDVQIRPDIAGGPEDAALVVWNRGTGVFGRIWKKTGDLEPAMGEIPIATNGSAPRVAGNKDGWVVVYQGAGDGDGNGIVMVMVKPNGDVSTPELVNDATTGLQDQPDVAMLPDGRFIVIWHAGGDIFFQRYNADGSRVPGTEDQKAVNTTTAGLQQNPKVAAGLGFFTVVWEDERGTIGARFIGGTSGFGYNSVTGQNDAFVANIPDPAGTSGLRKGPAVAIGGAGFVAIGWQDDSPSHFGVYVRRFPLPIGL
ncbi:hypothetical protein [Polyangium jinanense]|uniref:Uncharacterized protein n=1 Tax=Polyangium jinanense TaxID=2829994 RepID=A0A9X4AU47_9BACT|nr:hypothetical protein [Polyangium jinanense]MDC3959474.1 hypothetical protein [Polyangium jinanense]MDC3984908.1 hypothetical protein [Polyangium jinanense]